MQKPGSGRPLAAFINEQTAGRPLEALALPVACTVQRLRDGATVAFTRGNAGIAVQAAAAVEGQLAPVRILGERYADADLRTPLPVRLARSLGAQRVLAVDCSAHEDKAPPGTERWREGDLRKRALTQPDAIQADLLLHPDIGYYASISREYRERLIAIGRRETLAQAAALRALHAAG
jgi:NTE family protein